MATVLEAKYTTQYAGLVSTASLAAAFVVIMTTAYEVFPRLTRDNAKKDGTVEDYAMAYLYRPRSYFGKHRTPHLNGKPFAWVKVVTLPQSWFLYHSGLDSAVYIRFVTGCWLYMISQLLTTAVILIPLHIIYAPDTVARSSLARASVTALIDSTSGGRGLLWTHTVLLYWQTICWIAVVIWVGWGNIRMRREQLLSPLHDARDADNDGESQNLHEVGSTVNRSGWRFRTIKVSNIPLSMRSEDSLRRYFDACLSYSCKQPSNSMSPSATLPSTPVLPADSAIDHIVIVRNLKELHDISKKRETVLHDLETTHIQLAKAIFSAINEHLLQSRETHQTMLRRITSKRTPPDEHIAELTQLLGQYLRTDSPAYEIFQETYGKSAEKDTRSVWEALAKVPPALLDRYQPIVNLKVFRGQTAPAIDYYLTKLNLLSSLCEELRTQAPNMAACDTAFLTFKSAKDARLVKREMSWIKTRDFVCQVRMAPDARDLDWDKLVRANFAGDVFRSIIVHALVWTATIVWIIPIGALIGLVSIDNLSTRIPALARWLDDNPKAKSLASTLIPTVIITTVNMLVPTIIIQVSGRGQTFVTLSKLHHTTWCRYWKWAMINVVIAFCAGTALFTSLLGIFTGQSLSDTSSSPLNVIASSFSNGAIFFVSYSILIIGTQCFFELAQFMIPWFLYLGVRKATSLRQRFAKTQPRRFFSYTVAPNHTLIIAIVQVFSLLNPLPICFVFIYFTFALVVFKDHFARVYWRVYYEQNGRLFYMRTMRFSLDALTLGQVVNMALFFVLKDGSNGGACAALIPITVIVKLTLTRWYDQHMDAADAAFADLVSSTNAEELVKRPLDKDELSKYPLPELSVKGTLKLPFTRGPKVLKASKGPQAILQRLAAHVQINGSYADFRSSKEATRTDVPTAEATLCTLQTARLQLTRPPDRLIVPHTKLLRDDRQDFSTPYVDPYLVKPIEHCLWLPRNPLYDLDLNDSVDWYGNAFVSSDGGDGFIGGRVPTFDEVGED